MPWNGPALMRLDRGCTKTSRGSGTARRTWCLGMPMQRTLVVLSLLVSLMLGGCQRRDGASTLSQHETLAELRTIKGSLSVLPPGEKARRPYPRERLVEGE